MPHRLPTYVLLALIALAPALESLEPITTPLQDAPPVSRAEAPPLRAFMAAADSWRGRRGPSRVVVDQVVLVPDEATWLAAVATWDRGHWFPVLIEDVEYTMKFIRAFRPARVVRFKGKAPPLPKQPAARWAAVQAAVGRAWKEGGDVPRTDRPPVANGPPGVVFSHPESGALLGAAALCVGRFQPLLRLQPADGLRFDNLAPTGRAFDLARRFEREVMEAVPSYRRLGDDCDFVTLAGDYPYKYEGGAQTVQEGPAAFDDLVGRDLRGVDGAVRPRWAYTGRLLGDATTSVYRAMSALFLTRVESAVLFNGYATDGAPWADYNMAPTADLLTAKGVKVVDRHGRQATVSGLHSALDPINRAPLIFVNSSGGTTGFRVQAEAGHSADLPLTVPAAVYMIHSFSAANPRDPSTLAGRWLANGAFVYFGSAHEPYLAAFRTSRLVADLLARGVPMGAAVRLTPEELPPLGSAWRLAFLGDPLYMLELGPAPPLDRAATWGPSDAWPAYPRDPTPPADEAEPSAVLAWAVRAAIDDARAGRPPAATLAQALLDLPRARLDRARRALLDALVADTLMELGRTAELRAYLGAIPKVDVTADDRRWLETARVADFQRALTAGDWKAAPGLWKSVVDEPTTNEDMKQSATTRLGWLAGKVPGRRAELRGRLSALARDLPKESTMYKFVEDELQKFAKP